MQKHKVGETVSCIRNPIYDKAFTVWVDHCPFPSTHFLLPLAVWMKVSQPEYKDGHHQINFLTMSYLSPGQTSLCFFSVVIFCLEIRGTEAWKQTRYLLFMIILMSNRVISWFSIVGHSYLMVSSFLHHLFTWKTVTWKDRKKTKSL